MKNEYYPWGGEFTVCSPNGNVAVVLLTVEYVPPKTVAIYGPLKTENIGIEKIVANLISNPNIRFLVVCGNDIRGHRSGSSIIALHKNGIDENHKIIDAPGAIPYIENLKEEAIERFRAQIKIIDLIGVKEKRELDKVINDHTMKVIPAFGKPYIAIRIKAQSKVTLDDKRALHSKIVLNYMGKVEKRGK